MSCRSYVGAILGPYRGEISIVFPYNGESTEKKMGR